MAAPRKKRPSDTKSEPEVSKRRQQPGETGDEKGQDVVDITDDLPYSLADAKRHLQAADPRFLELIIDDPYPRRHLKCNPWRSLVTSILGQQVINLHEQHCFNSVAGRLISGFRFHGRWPELSRIASGVCSSHSYQRFLSTTHGQRTTISSRLPSK